MNYTLLQDKRFRLVLFDFLLLLLGLIGFLQLTRKADLPLTIESTRGALIVHPNSGTDNVLVPDGSILKSISGKFVFTKEDIEFICDGLRVGESVIAEIEKDNIRIRVPVILVNFYNTTYLITAAFVGLFFFFVALFVLLQRPRGELSAVTFHHSMMAVYAMILTTWANYRFPSLFMGILLRALFSAAYAFMPVFFVRFSFVFPRVKWNNNDKLMRVMLIISGLLTLGMAFAFFLAAIETSPKWFDIYEAWFDPTRFYFAISCLFTVGNFVHSYKYSLEESERRKMRWILLGTGIGVFAFLFLWQLPQLFTSAGIINEDLLLLIMTVIPLTYGFSILRYHAFDIDLIFKRSTVYGIVLLFMIAIYAIFIGGFTILMGKMTVINSVFLSGAAAILSAFLIQPLRNTAQKYVDRKFFVVQYSYREVQEKILAKMESALSLEDLVRQMIKEINNIIPMEKLSFIRLIEGENSNFIVITSDENKVNEYDFNLIFRLTELSGPGSLPLMLGNYIEKGIRFNSDAEDVLNELGLAAVFPVFSQKTELDGFFLVGKKRSEFVFSVEDVSLINFACQEVAGAIEKIELRNKLIIEKEISSKLKELSDLKSFFVSSVSHDLKTPLTSIKMFSEILRTGSHSKEKSDEYLVFIEGESDRLSRLINNVLDFSRIEKGVKEYNFSIIDLNRVAQETVRLMQYQFQINSFKVNEHYSEESCMINADYDALIEVVMNILSNAIKYSDEKRVVSISTQKSGKEAVLRVQDEGIGIPETSIARIFDPFLRIQYRTDHNAGGTGLGLTIVKHIMDAHNGRIEVTSIVNKGSTFSLYFPLKYSQEN